MPINYMTPLDSLRSLPGSGFDVLGRRKVPGMGESIPGAVAGEGEFQVPDESSHLMSLQQQRLSELDDPRFQDRPDLKGLRGSLQSDIGENPLTQQTADVAGYLGRRGKAVEQGFGGANPVAEQAEAGRQVEQQKLTMPLQVAQAGAAGDLAKQQEASRGALAIQESKGSQAENFLQMLNNARMSGADVRGVTLPGGGGSVSYQTPPKPSVVPTGTSHDLMLARQAAVGVEPTQSGIGAYFSGTSGQPTKEHAALQQAIQTALMHHPAPPGLKEYAMAIAKDPEASKLSLDEILQAKGEVLDPTEKDMLQELLGITRGF